MTFSTKAPVRGVTIEQALDATSELNYGDAVAIVLAGGLGTRFGGAQPKQLAELNGRPVLAHTLSRFVRPELFSQCVIVANSDWFGPIQEVVTKVSTGVPTLLVPGGASRNESVWNALRAVRLGDNTKCLVHDGVRPLVTEKLIRSVLDALDLSDSVLPVIDSIDPLVSVDHGRVIDIESRQVVYRGQSPQGFHLGTLRNTFESIGLEEMSRYSTVYEVLRRFDPEADISTVAGDLDNLKITQPIDHVIAEELLTRNYQ